MRRYIVEVEKSSMGEYYWRLIAANGRTLAHSETYNSKATCIRIAKTLQNDLVGGVDRCVLREV